MSTSDPEASKGPLDQTAALKARLEKAELEIGKKEAGLKKLQGKNKRLEAGKQRRRKKNEKLRKERSTRPSKDAHTCSDARWEWCTTSQSKMSY